MGISSRKEQVASSRGKRGRWRIFVFSPYYLLLATLFLSCLPTPTTQKIGLIAPFEGVYRELGYEALAATRAAIGDAGPAGNTLVPLALDSSGDPEQARRSLEKLLVDPAVMGYVGLLLPSTARVAMSEGDLPTGLIPFAVSSDGQFATSPRYSEGDAADWAITLAVSVSDAAQSQGAARLVLADNAIPFAAGWPTNLSATLSRRIDLPVEQVDSANEIRSDDVVFWLGTPADAAAFVNQLRRRQPDVSVWLGPHGYLDVVKDRLTTRDKIYWATWQHEMYPTWSAQHGDAAPLAHATYLATRQLIEGEPQPGEWSVALWALQEDGTSAPFATN